MANASTARVPVMWDTQVSPASHSAIVAAPATGGAQRPACVHARAGGWARAALSRTAHRAARAAVVAPPRARVCASRAGAASTAASRAARRSAPPTVRVWRRRPMRRAGTRSHAAAATRAGAALLAIGHSAPADAPPSTGAARHPARVAVLRAGQATTARRRSAMVAARPMACVSPPVSAAALMAGSARLAPRRSARSIAPAEAAALLRALRRAHARAPPATTGSGASGRYAPAAALVGFARLLTCASALLDGLGRVAMRPCARATAPRVARAWRLGTASAMTVLICCRLPHRRWSRRPCSGQAQQLPRAQAIHRGCSALCSTASVS